MSFFINIMHPCWTEVLFYEKYINISLVLCKGETYWFPLFSFCSYQTSQASSPGSLSTYLTKTHCGHWYLRGQWKIRPLWCCCMGLGAVWDSGRWTWTVSLSRGPFMPSTCWALARAADLTLTRLQRRLSSSLWSPSNSGERSWAWKVW